jgi:hypothetical protein
MQRNQTYRPRKRHRPTMSRRYLETKPWKRDKEEEAGLGLGVDEGEVPEGGFVECKLFPNMGYPDDAHADEVAECVDFVLNPASNVRSLVVCRLVTPGDNRSEVAAHVLRLLARLPPCVNHLTIEAARHRVPAEWYTCWAPKRHPHGLCPLVSLRITLPWFGGGAAALAEAIRDHRMPHLKELRWEAEGTSDPDTRKITDQWHMDAYSGLIQACVESATMEVLVVYAWYVLRARSLESLASGVSPLKVLNLDCAELVMPNPHMTEARNDDSLVPHPHPRGFDDAAARLLASALVTCRQLQELHLRTNWFRTHESCRLLQEALGRNTTLRTLVVQRVVDTSYKLGSAVPAIVAGLRTNRSIRHVEITDACDVAARHEHYYGEHLDDPLARNLLELVLEDNLTLRTIKLGRYRLSRIEDSVAYVLQNNRRFVELCDVVVVARKSRTAGGVAQRANETQSSDDTWRRGLLRHASERTADSLVNVTAIYLLLRHNPSPGVLRRIQGFPEATSGARFPPTADHIPRIIRRRLLREAGDPASLEEGADRGPRRRLPVIASSPLLGDALGWEAY